MAHLNCFPPPRKSFFSLQQTFCAAPLSRTECAFSSAHDCRLPGRMRVLSACHNKSPLCQARLDMLEQSVLPPALFPQLPLPTMTSNQSQPPPPNQLEEGPIVQYIVVRTDLDWSQGALIAQACHASVASIARTLTSPVTKQYLDDLNNMHKVILKADKLEDLERAETKLKELNVACHMWIEKPENVATCLACSPQPKPLVQAVFRHLKLLK